VVLDNGRGYYFGNGNLWSSDYSNSEHSGSFEIRGHNIQSIALGYYHVVMVTMKGSVFGFGRYHQLGVVDPIALSGWKHGKTVMPTEVFAGVIKSKGAARLPNSKEQ
jgi:alpha-tubulin suppressor-like RCC1 family protein